MVHVHTLSGCFRSPWQGGRSPRCIPPVGALPLCQPDGWHSPQDICNKVTTWKANHDTGKRRDRLGSRWPYRVTTEARGLCGLAPALVPIGKDQEVKGCQRGIAIGPILFVIALLAVLASAVAAGSGSFTASTSSETAKAKASALIEIGQNLKMGFDRLMASGIAYGDVVINKYHTTEEDSLFSPMGGGIALPSESMGKSGAGWRYPYALMNSLGNYCPKRIAVIQVENATICSQLNDSLGNGTTPDAANVADPGTACIGIPGSLAQKMAGCYESSTQGSSGFYFYQVLGIDPGEPSCAMNICPD